jgi:hypothetical protein
MFWIKFRGLSILIFHVFLAILSGINSLFFVVFFYSQLVYFVSKFVAANRTTVSHIFYIVYLVSFEFIARILNVHDFIPYEFGKYFILYVSIHSLIKSASFDLIIWNRSWLLFLTLVPAFLYDISDQRRFVDIVFSGFGPLAGALMFIAVQKIRFNYNSITSIFKSIIFPLITGLIFLIIETPSLDNTRFEINANFATTAGAATNQVATCLGLGFFVMFYSWKEKLNLTGHRFLDLFFLVLFFLQGLVTFSRGGMLVGLISVIIYLFGVSKKNERFVLKTKSKGVIFLLIVLVTVIISVFYYVNEKTDGKLIARYSGETEGTFRGTQEKTLSKVTSGRNDLLKDDYRVWKENFIFGVGVGSSMYERAKFGTNMAPHIELSRLLSEHGLIGLIHFLIILKLGILLWKARNSSDIIFFIFFIIFFLTTFHSASRTFVVPLFFGLCGTYLRYNNIITQRTLS